MSHIFDALQESVAEGPGVEVPSSSLAMELLQAAERRVAAEGATAVTAPTHGEVALESIAELKPAAAVRAAVEPPPLAELANRRAEIDQFSQFQSLKLLVSPQSRLVCITDKESLAAEKFRFLSVRLRHLQQSRPLKKLLITSTIPQEGKSMVAANLACSLARKTQQKTLLLEGDLRRPSLAQLFGLGKISGVSEWLQGERGPMSNLYHLEGAGFWLLPAGSSARNPLELMQSGRLSPLLDQLTAWFDWILIDSPPVLPLADTSVWMRLADGILLVIRQGTTEKKSLQRGLEAIEPAKLLGGLLNCSANIAHSDYYHQYSGRAVSEPTDQPTKKQP
jgi:capsular exopolysaccharide synthesis family protein